MQSITRKSHSLAAPQVSFWQQTVHMFDAGLCREYLGLWRRQQHSWPGRPVHCRNAVCVTSTSAACHVQLSRVHARKHISLLLLDGSSYTVQGEVIALHRPCCVNCLIFLDSTGALSLSAAYQQTQQLIWVMGTVASKLVMPAYNTATALSVDHKFLVMQLVFQQNQHITKLDYEEAGPTVVHKKCC